MQVQHVREAALQINPVFMHSPQFLSEPLSEQLGCEIVVMLETLNPIRSFKGRGASDLLEPSGAAVLAAVVADSERFRGQRVALVLGSSNITTEQMVRWLTLSEADETQPKAALHYRCNL